MLTLIDLIKLMDSKIVNGCHKTRIAKAIRKQIAHLGDKLDLSLLNLHQCETLSRIMDVQPMTENAKQLLQE